MKKTLVYIIALVTLCSLIFSGCEFINKEDTDPSKTKVGFLFKGSVDDGGFNTAQNKGRLYLEQSLNTKIETTYMEGLADDTEAVSKSCEQLINDGCKIIIGTSFGYQDAMEKSAKIHPDIKYLNCSSYKTASNMSNFDVRDYEARYLAGIVAGMKTKTNKIGYVVPVQSSEYIRAINAFTIGAQSVNKDAVVQVSYTGNDTKMEKQWTNTLISSGADVIVQQDASVEVQKILEEKNIWFIGDNVDVSKVGNSNSYLTSLTWNWGPFYTEQVSRILEGNFKVESYWGSINEENSKSIVYLAPFSKNAPQGANEIVDKVKADISKGKNKIFVGPIYDNDGNLRLKQGETLSDRELLRINWFVKGVEGEIGYQK